MLRLLAALLMGKGKLKGNGKPMTTQTEKEQLVTSAQASVDAAQAVKTAVDALAVDPDTNPLQAQLDAANATITSLQAKIDAAKAAAQADKDADAAAVAGQGVLDALQ